MIILVPLHILTNKQVMSNKQINLVFLVAVVSVSLTYLYMKGEYKQLLSEKENCSYQKESCINDLDIVLTLLIGSRIEYREIRQTLDQEDIEYEVEVLRKESEKVGFIILNDIKLNFSKDSVLVSYNK